MTFRNRQVLALIPARGGSKGVPRKNLRIINGAPLVFHTLKAGRDSKVIDTVYLSSDNTEILEIGRSIGAETINRPDSAATDTATASQVVSDFISRLSIDLADLDPFIVYLQPTSPLRQGKHIDWAFDEMEARKGSTCVSVVELKKTPYKSFTVNQAGLLQSLFDENLSNANRQSLPPSYYPNGAIYIFPLSEFKKRNGFPSNGSVPYIMSEIESIDIDTEADIQMMEIL